MTNDFPQTIPSKEAQYATYIPARNPVFKVHSNEGLAHSALGQRSLDEKFAKYVMQGGVWVLVWSYVPGKDCETCGRPFDNDRWGRIRRYRPYKGTGPVWKQPVVCATCYSTERDKVLQEQQEQRDRAELARLSAKYTN